MTPKPQSGLGIASLLIGLGLGFLMLLLFMVAAMVEMSSPRGMDPDSVEALLIGFAFIALLLALVLPLALAIAGLVQEGRSRVFPVLGLIVSVGVGLISVFLMLLGVAMGF